MRVHESRSTFTARGKHETQKQVNLLKNAQRQDSLVIHGLSEASQGETALNSAEEATNMGLSDYYGRRLFGN